MPVRVVYDPRAGIGAEQEQPGKDQLFKDGTQPDPDITTAGNKSIGKVGGVTDWVANNWKWLALFGALGIYFYYTHRPKKNPVMMIPQDNFGENV